MKALAIILAGAVPALAQEAPIGLPSGRVVSFHDVIAEQDVLRYRFLEPELAQVVDVTGYDVLEADMRFLCETVALARVEGPAPRQIFVSISDRPVIFGDVDPEAVQVFEAYRPEGDACIWEGL